MLTEKQRRFVDEYLIDRNAAAAYRRVYKANGNSAETAACRAEPESDNFCEDVKKRYRFVVRVAARNAVTPRYR